MNTNSGFTLLELLATLTIIAILTGIALPQYEAYKARGFDTTTQMDLRSIALAQEAYFFDTRHYLACNNVECTALPGIARLSDGTEVAISINELCFTAEASNAKGTGKVYRWSSTSGGLVTE